VEAGDVFDEGEESLDLEKHARSGEVRLDPRRRPAGEVGASADGGLRLKHVSGRRIQARWLLSSADQLGEQVGEETSG
jgi:hypothetical protein